MCVSGRGGLSDAKRIQNKCAQATICCDDDNYDGEYERGNGEYYDNDYGDDDDDDNGEDEDGHKDENGHHSVSYGVCNGNGN